MTIKVVIAGSRDMDCYQIVKDKFIEFSEHIESDFEIVSGRARGADQMGEKLAEELGLSVALFPAEWDKHGKSAGYIRNADMAEYGDVLLAFWDGKSRGTRMMIDLSRKKGLLVIVHICELIKGSETVGDGMHVNYTKYYKQWYVDAVPYGEKIDISYEEYHGGN